VFALAAAAHAAPAETAVVTYVESHRTARVEAVVEAVRQSTIAAQVNGRIVAVPVRAGDTVKSGQLLVQIDARSATQAEAASQSQFREAQANLVNAKAKYERSRQLAERKFISQAALDQAAAEQKRARQSPSKYRPSDVRSSRSASRCSPSPMSARTPRRFASTFRERPASCLDNMHARQLSPDTIAR